CDCKGTGYIGSPGAEQDECKRCGGSYGKKGTGIDPVFLDWLEDDGPKPWSAETADFVEAFLVPPRWQDVCLSCCGEKVKWQYTGKAYISCHECCGRGYVVECEPAEDTSLQPLLVAWLRRCGDGRAERVE